MTPPPPPFLMASLMHSFWLDLLTVLTHEARFKGLVVSRHRPTSSHGEKVIHDEK